MKKENINFKRLMTFAIVASMCLVVVPTVSADIPTEMVAYWKFDEGVGSMAYDTTSNDNDGVLSGGKFGNALVFDGVSSYVSVPTGTLSIAGPFTVEAWIYRNALGDLQYVLSKDDGPGMPGSNYNLLSFSENKLALFLKGLTGGSVTLGKAYFDSGGGGIVGVTQMLDIGSWHHVAGVFTGTELQVYLDGVLDGSVTITGGTPYTNTADLWIGNRKYSPGYFNGKIDEVRISNVAITSFDLNVAPTVEDTTVALWHFDESIGLVAHDETIYGNDGTITGATWAGPTWTTGQVGNALSFDGMDDYITMDPSDFWFGTGQSFTAECWIKTEQNPSNRAQILGIYTGPTYPTPNQFWSIFLETSGKLAFWLRVDNSVAQTVVYSTTTVNDNSWHHIAVVKDTTSLMRIYVDGTEEASTAFTDGETYNNYEFHIGNGHWNRYYNGLVDEVAIYNTALFASEISSHYYAGLAGHGYCDCPDTVHVDDDYNQGSCDGHNWQYDAFDVIQDAIDAVCDGGTVNVADGIYTITAAINVNKGVTITGNIANPENVVVQYSSASTSLNGFEIGAADITIQGFKIIGCFRGVHFGRSDVTSTGCTIANCVFDSNSENAIGEVAAENTMISNNAITNCNMGIEIRANEATSLASRTEVTCNTISSCSQACIQTYLGKYVYIHDNTISSTNDKGINIIRPTATGTLDRIQVIGNTISETKWPGIQVIGAPYTYVYDNTLTKCNYHGGDGTGNWDYASIHVQDDIGPTYSHHTVIDSNTVSDGINGIQTWSNDVTITNNEIYDMGLTYADTKGTAEVGDGVYYNSGIIIGTNWLTNNFKPTGATVTCNSIHDNYWGLYVRDYATLSPGDLSVLSVTADCNWWGAHDGPGGNGPGTGDAVSTNVDFDPWIGITELSRPTDPVKLGDPASIYLSFTCNKDTATLDWGDGTPVISYSSESETTTESHTYSAAGVYTVTLTIQDCCGRSYSREFRYVVVYDPSDGFVTGGGWIDSPAGAYREDPDLTGKANFGFVSKYKKGQSTPTGNTEFRFKAADMNFHSSDYEWLVITGGGKAMYKGTGTINGTGNYGFMISAIDDDIAQNTEFDMFRIKIWDKNNNDVVIYDNQPGTDEDANPTTAIGGGQIKIHQK